MEIKDTQQKINAIKKGVYSERCVALESNLHILRKHG